MYGLVFMLPALLFMDFRWGFERLADPVNLFNLLFFRCRSVGDVFRDLEYGSQAAGSY